jgi:hypothetical protein
MISDVLPGGLLFQIGDVAFRADSGQIMIDVIGTSVNMPETAFTLYASIPSNPNIHLKVGSFSFSFNAGLERANGGEKDTFPGGSQASAGDCLLSGAIHISLQIDSLDPWAFDVQFFTIDLTRRFVQVSTGVDLIQKAAEFLESSVITDFAIWDPSLCRIMPPNAPPCNGEVGITAGSSVSLLLVSPSGKMVGTSSSGTQVNDIQGAWYSGVNVDPQIVIITNPEQGTYQVTFTGQSSGQLTYGVASFTSSKLATTSYSSQVSAGEVLQSYFSVTGSRGVAVQPLTEQSTGMFTSNTITTIATAVVTALIVLIGSEVLLQGRRKGAKSYWKESTGQDLFCPRCQLLVHGFFSEGVLVCPKCRWPRDTTTLRYSDYS